MAVALSLFAGAGQQFFDDNGDPLSGGKIYTYSAGTTTPAVTYTSPSGTATHANPIILDAAGRVPAGGEIWLAVGPSYKFIVRTSTNVLIATYDNIPSAPQPAISNDAASITYEQGYTVTAGSFVPGQLYQIYTVGSTDFTTIGAASNASGVHFIATGAGTGSGTAKLSQTLQSKLSQMVSVQDFGASATASDAVNTAALQAAAASGLPFTLGNLTINLTSTATLTASIYGPGTLRGSGVLLSQGANNVVVDGITFVGTATSGIFAPIAVSANNRSGLTVRNCTLTDCRVTMRNTALARQTDFRFQNNTVNADFSLIEHVVNQNDVVTVRGIDGVWITGNNFSVTNVHRVLKIADTEAATTSGTAFRSRNVFITNNRIVGSTDSFKQVMDLYFFTSDVTISNNMVDVTGFSVVIENKTGEAQNYTQNTFVIGNKLSNDNAVIGLQGSYGALTPGYDVGYQNAVISGNTIISTTTTISMLKYPLTARFYDDIQITNNNFVTPVVFTQTTGIPAALMASNAFVTFTDNTISNGVVFFNSATTNQAGQSFASVMQSIVCCNNTISNFGGSGISGGILVQDTGAATSLRILIEGNYIKQDVDDAVSAGCVAIYNATVNLLSVCNNIGVMANAAEQRLRILTSTITSVIEQNNSWNQVGRASTTYDPPSIGAGGVNTTTISVVGAVAATDVVTRVQFSQALAGLVLSAWVSAADTVTVQFSNPTSGAINLASGTLQVVVQRFTAV